MEIKANKIKNIILLQLTIVLYTTSGIMSKKASGYKFLSTQFILFYCLEILILGVYAIFWQQIIKKFDISTAYSNKGLSIFWSLLWSVIFFRESISMKNILGAAIIIFGIMMVNSDD